ncbi:GDP-mannose 4,6-dehydratase [Rhodanobacter sp. 7MK24]|uniref:GDP-mannose 4,6-dehydratase n=1 Tax=Rhodanobacter sp. 7MK24 TaxID=2775922 RepID=UPI0017864F60|nr:GDP-mannose 4,6-dehydratase [Rhodanobacter sp. 7MK24]MBD8880543.1 GDP-mannose 4,6-dehydratase [Rhodanobacter sp. 7MK24]
MKSALICGVSGQDGSYLARLLISKGYEVYGSSRDAQMQSFDNLRALGIKDKVNLVSMATTDFRSVLHAVSHVAPDEIYNLAGQSSVAMSFEQPLQTMESIGISTLNLLEAIRFTAANTKFYSAGSSECFGASAKQPCDENTPFRPRSPYAVAKAAAFWSVANYREAYGLHACTGILFNHESPLRPERFVTRKIIATAARIASGSNEKLHLGNLSISRDWGWAPEYVEAMWMMMQLDQAQDFVIATGQTCTLEEFVDAAFDAVGLHWHEHVVVDETLFRPADLAESRANPAKAQSALGWRARHAARDVVRMMLDAELGKPASTTR